MTVFHCVSVISSKAASRCSPALATTMSSVPKSRAGLLEHLDDLRLARHVGAQRHGAAAHRSDQVGDFMGFVLAGDIVDDDRRAGLGQRDRHRPADPRIGAGDQRLLPGKRSGRRLRWRAENFGRVP